MIVEAAANKTLLRLWHSLASESLMRVRVGLPDSASSLLRAVEPHVAILEAIERGNDKAPGRLPREHAASAVAPGPAPTDG